MESDAEQYLDAAVYDVQGSYVGTVTDVYVDDDTGRPVWLLVGTGFPPRGSHVPLGDVRRYDDGYQLPFTIEQVRSAPEIDIARQELSEDDEAALALYYGIPTGQIPPASEAA